MHLFVFYYGIMGDITPPVGLATFAAAAISGEDPIKTGIQGAIYALRTVILPFIWIFNPQLLLIDIDGWFELVLVVVASHAWRCCVFAAVTMNWFRVKRRWWENWCCWRSPCSLLFRPDFFMDRIAPEYRPDVPATQVFDVARELPGRRRPAGAGDRGHDDRGRGREQDGGACSSATAGGDGRKRLADAGLTLVAARATRCRSAQRQVRHAARRRRASSRAGTSQRVHGADRPAQPALVLPAGAAAGRAGVVGAGPARWPARGTVLTRKPA